MIDTLVAQIAATSWLEWLAVALALAYLVLAVRQSIWCWPCAFGSTALYIWLFHEAALFMESALNVFYLVVAVYGFYYWFRGGKGERPVTTLAPRYHVIAVLVIAGLVAVSGRWLAAHTSQAYPYVDAFTTWSAVFATWLTARKVLENWGYWLVIDSVSIWLYLQRDLALTAALFVVYLVLIPVGFVSWRQSLEADR